MGDHGVAPAARHLVDDQLAVRVRRSVRVQTLQVDGDDVVTISDQLCRQQIPAQWGLCCAVNQHDRHSVIFADDPDEAVGTDALDTVNGIGQELVAGRGGSVQDVARRSDAAGP